MTNRVFHRDKSDFQKNTNPVSLARQRVAHLPMPRSVRAASNLQSACQNICTRLACTRLHTCICIFVHICICLCVGVYICLLRYICICRPNLTPLLVRINWEKLEWAKETLMVGGWSLKSTETRLSAVSQYLSSSQTCSK